MFIGTVPASLRLWSTAFVVVSNAWHLERKQECRQGLTDMMGQEKKSRLYALSTCLVLIGFPFVLFDIVFFLLQSSLLLKNNVFFFSCRASCNCFLLLLCFFFFSPPHLVVLYLLQKMYFHFGCYLIAFFWGKIGGWLLNRGKKW